MTLNTFDQINDIVDRAINTSTQLTDEHRLSLVMDLDSIQNELDFKKLMDFPKFDFMHDIIGIMNNMDRSTYPGKLTNCFVPRCSR